MITAHLISKIVSSNSSEAFNLFEKSRFGEKLDDKIIYSLTEAFYLVKSKKMKILNHQNKEISPNNLSKKLTNIDKNFKVKIIVFSDLRKKGYIVKTALKYGADFRIYEKGEKVSAKHSSVL